MPSKERLGTGVVEGLALRLREVLPRFRLREAYWAVGLDRAIEPSGDDLLRRAGAARLVEAAAHALAIGPGLGGRGDAQVRGPRAVAQLGRLAGRPDGEQAWTLGVGRRALRKMRQEPVDARLQRAMRVRIALEQRVAEEGTGRPAAQVQQTTPGSARPTRP